MIRKGAAYPGIGDWVLLAVTLTLALSLLIPGAEYRLRAAKFLRATVLYPFRLVHSYASDPTEPAEELDTLRVRLAEQRLDEALFQEALLENHRLRDLLDFARREQRSVVLTQVVGRSLDRHGEVLTISRGIRDSVRIGQTVVGRDGLVGVVVGAGTRESWARTLRHRALPISGMLQETRYVGVLRWDATHGMLEMEGVPVQSPVAVGERVVTSGYGRVFPKGLPVGSVVSVGSDSTALVKRIFVRPFVDLDRTEELFLLIGEDETGG